MKKTSYFTLGQIHLYRYNGQILDKDCVIKITDEEPREKMFELFDKEFAFEYEEKPDMKFFPKGVYNLTENKWEK